MDCREAVRRMHGVLDGSAPAGEREAAERHASACPACRGRFDALRAVDSVAASDRGMEGAAAAAARSRLFALLEREGVLPPPAAPSAPVVPFPSRRLAFGALGAVAALLAAVALWRVEPGGRQAPPPVVAEAPAPRASGGGGEEGASAPGSAVPRLTGEEREIVALLDLLESPVLEEGAEGEGEIEELLGNGEGARG